MEIIRERERVVSCHYEREFSVQPLCGYSFPCDKEGNLLQGTTEAASRNYKDCLDGKYPQFIDRGIVRHELTYMQAAIGICEVCGREVELDNQYYGSCECQNCGAWYNLFGQRVKAPNEYDINSNY